MAGAAIRKGEHMQDVEIIGMLKSYIKKTLVGMGALKGAPCEIQSIVENPTGVWTITFKWEDTEGTTHTDALVLHDGAAASDYLSLDNLPQINSVELIGNVSLSDLGLGAAAVRNVAAAVTEDDTDLVTGGAVFDAIEASAGNISDSQYAAIAALFA